MRSPRANRHFIRKRDSRMNRLVVLTAAGPVRTRDAHKVDTITGIDERPSPTEEAITMDRADEALSIFYMFLQ